MLKYRPNQQGAIQAKVCVVIHDHIYANQISYGPMHGFVTEKYGGAS